MKKKSIVIISGILIIIIGIVVYFSFQNKNRLTTDEKEWLTQSVSKVQNIHVINNENIFGNNGKGLFYSFIDDFQKKYNIAINSITFKSDEVTSGATFGVSNILPEGALNFYQDHYVYVSKEREGIPNISYLNNKVVGVLNNNKTHLSKYLKNVTVIYKTYDTKDELISAFNNGEITKMIVPRIEYIDTILEKNYYINYHFSDIPYY